MRKRTFGLGILVSLLIVSVLPVVADKYTFSGYIDKKQYWKFGNRQEELERSGVSTLPASYDSRKCGYVTALKNQGDLGTCWAFATIAATETSLIKHGLANKEENLSEYHLSYFSYSENIDPLENTEGDYYVPHYTLEGKLRAGGNVQDAIEQLAKWGGPVDEDWVPYSDALNLVEPSKELAFESKYHLKNAYYADCSKQEMIKKLVYEHGAASAAYYADYKYLKQINGESTYHIPNITMANHAVCIVGWDDHYKKESFQNQPPGDGAWLCKDSDILNSNYTWVSYYTSLSDVVAVEFEDSMLLDNNYQYDGCVSGTSGYGDVVGENNKAKSFMNVFEAKASGEYLEELEAVSIHVNGNETYSISVYVNPVLNSEGKITDYEYKSAPIQCVAGEYAGIRKVELKETIYLNEGDLFGVEVQGDDMENYAVSSSTKYGYEGMEQGQCFIGIDENSEMKYSDLANGIYQVTPRIKAFTKCTQIPCATDVFLGTEQITLSVGESQSIEADVIAPSGGLNGVTFYSSNPAIASVAANGEVTAHGLGTCEIVVQCTYGKASKICKIQVGNVLANSLETEISVKLTEGEKYTLSNILDANATIRTLEYVSENPNVAIVDENGQIEAVSPGETRICVKTTDGSELTAMCQVTVVSKKIGVEAIYLSINENTLLVGQSASLVVSLHPTNAEREEIIYYVSNPQVLSVQGNAVHALSPGTACITAQVKGRDIWASVNIQVYEKETGSSEKPKQQPEITVGHSFQYKDLKYKVTSKDSVTLIGTTKKTIKKIMIPNFVKYKGNVYYVTNVSDGAFSGLKKLTTVEVGKNVKKIGKKSFYNCKKLKNVTISSLVITKVGKNSFAKTKGDLIIKVPKKKMQDYKKLFKSAGLSKLVKWKKK